MSVGGCLLDTNVLFGLIITLGAVSGGHFNPAVTVAAAAIARATTVAVTTPHGLLREGNHADVVVFDPATVAPQMPTLEYDLPAGARRLKQKAVGIKATIVNGEVLLRNNEHSGALPGKLLRGPLAATA